MEFESADELRERLRLILAPEMTPIPYETSRVVIPGLDQFLRRGNKKGRRSWRPFSLSENQKGRRLTGALGVGATN